MAWTYNPTYTAKGVAGKYYGGVEIGDELWFSPYEGSDVMIYNFVTETFSSIAHGESGTQPFAGIVYDEANQNVWLVPYDAPNGVVIDVTTKTVIHRFECPDEKGSQAFQNGFVNPSDGYIWILPCRSDEIWRFHPTNFQGQEIADIGPRGHRRKGSAYYYPYIWIGPSSDDEYLVRYHMGDGRIERYPTPKDLSNRSLCVFQGHYVFFCPTGTNKRFHRFNIAQQTWDKLAHHEGTDSYYGCFVDSDYVWFTADESDDNIRIDPHSMALEKYAHNDVSDEAFSSGVYAPDHDQVVFIPADAANLIFVPVDYGQDIVNPSPTANIYKIVSSQRVAYVVANNVVDAIAMAKASYDTDNDAAWDVAQPEVIHPATDLSGWRLRVVIEVEESWSKAADYSIVVTGNEDDLIDDLGIAMAAALVTAGLASTYTPATKLLVVDDGTNDLGDRVMTVEMYPPLTLPDPEHPVPGFVTNVVSTGAESDPLQATLVDTVIPSIAGSYAAFESWKVELNEQDAPTRPDGVDSVIVCASNEQDAKDVAKGLYTGDSNQAWDNATVTRNDAGYDFSGWCLHVVLNIPGESVPAFDQEVLGQPGYTLEHLIAQMVHKLIEAGYTASYSSSDKRLVVATFGDNVGNYKCVIDVLQPGHLATNDQFVSQIYDQGSVDDPLIALFDTIRPIPSSSGKFNQR